MYAEEARPVREIAAELRAAERTVYAAIRRFRLARPPTVTSQLFDPQFDTVRPGGSFETFIKAEDGVARASIYQFARRRGYRVSIRKIGERTYRVTRLR